MNTGFGCLGLGSEMELTSREGSGTRRDLSSLHYLLHPTATLGSRNSGHSVSDEELGLRELSRGTQLLNGRANMVRPKSEPHLNYSLHCRLCRLFAASQQWTPDQGPCFSPKIPLD